MLLLIQQQWLLANAAQNLTQITGIAIKWRTGLQFYEWTLWSKFSSDQPQQKFVLIRKPVLIDLAWNKFLKQFKHKHAQMDERFKFIISSDHEKKEPTLVASSRSRQTIYTYLHPSFLLLNHVSEFMADKYRFGSFTVLWWLVVAITNHTPRMRCFNVLLVGAIEKVRLIIDGENPMIFRSLVREQRRI